MSRGRLLDLFCGEGGAGMGYHRAGWDVVGVDVVKQPRYPFEFHQADALTYPLKGYDAIHASPPCKLFTSLMSLHGPGEHIDLLTPMRARLEGQATPWVIENVPGAPLRGNVILLCGSMFNIREGDRYLQRHRYFESPWLPFELMMSCNHRGEARVVAGHMGQTAGLIKSQATSDEARRLMDMPWATVAGLSQAIPPAYTEWIGRRLP